MKKMISHEMLYVVEWNIYQDKDFDTSLFLFYKTRRTICDMSQFSQKQLR